MPVFPPTDASTAARTVCGNVDAVHASLVCGGSETAEVADHAAAEVHHYGGACGLHIGKLLPERSEAFEVFVGIA